MVEPLKTWSKFQGGLNINIELSLGFTVINGNV